MHWSRGGLIYSPGRPAAASEVAEGRSDWAASHAQCPTPDRLSDETVRIYFGTRDAANRTRPTFIEVDAARPERIQYVHDSPVLALGELGCFDDAGVLPTCVIDVPGAKFLYYAGCNTSTTVPYRMSIGVAVSEDNGRSFRRIHDGPILDRTADEPHFCSTPFVRHDANGWRMWYLSCLGWRLIRDRPEPHYHVKVATSDDGIRWVRDGSVAIAQQHGDEAIARPWVVGSANCWRMWYCHRSLDSYRTDKQSSYRIGYAKSVDGLAWTRRDAEAGLSPGTDGWDCEMTAYPAVYEHSGRLFLLYNGNDFGRGGFGYAICEDENALQDAAGTQVGDLRR